MSACLFLGRRLHAHWHCAAALDGLRSHGGLLSVCGAVFSAAQVVSPGPGALAGESWEALSRVLTAGWGVRQPEQVWVVICQHHEKSFSCTQSSRTLLLTGCFCESRAGMKSLVVLFVLVKKVFIYLFMHLLN